MYHISRYEKKKERRANALHDVLSIRLAHDGRYALSKSYATSSDRGKVESMTEKWHREKFLQRE